MRVYLCGSRQFGLEVYRLAQSLGHEVAGVSAPAWRADGELPDRLRNAAEVDGVPWLEAGRLDAGAMPEGVDLILAAHSHDFIGRRTRDKARLGGVGYHPSLLPRHRGRDAVRWTIHMGDAVAGGSVYWLTDRVDGGPLAAQDFCHVRPGTTAEGLWRDQLAPMGLELFRAVLTDLAAGVVRQEPQDEACATWEPSWDRPPVNRPDLFRLGPPGGSRVVQRAARSGR